MAKMSWVLIMNLKGTRSSMTHYGRWLTIRLNSGEHPPLDFNRESSAKQVGMSKIILLIR